MTRRTTLMLSLALASALLTACATGSAARTTAAAGDACPSPGAPVLDVMYAAEPGARPRSTSLDVYPPRTVCPAPVVVWVHGGGWQHGDKRKQIADKVRLFNREGWLLVSVNYRLTNPARAVPIAYPTHNEDVADAVAWVHDNVARYGGDPNRIALLGHSAGAQIVASIGTDERYLGAHGLALSDLRCVGALDTEGFDVGRLAAAGNPVYRAAFGDDPATWADASPIEHVDAGKGVPAFLVVERGAPARRSTQEAFANALRGAGVAVSVLDAGALTHGQVNSEIGAPADTVMTPPLLAWLSGCLRSAEVKPVG